jgi:hypothetical protein
MLTKALLIFDLEEIPQSPTPQTNPPLYLDETRPPATRYVHVKG